MKVLVFVTIILILSITQSIALNPLAAGSTTSPCTYILGNHGQNPSYLASFKDTNSFLNNGKNFTALQISLSKSPRCLVYSIKPSEDTLLWLSKLQRHLIIVDGVRCAELLPSHFNVHLYCVEEDPRVYK